MKHGSLSQHRQIVIRPIMALIYLAIPDAPSANTRNWTVPEISDEILIANIGPTVEGHVPHKSGYGVAEDVVLVCEGVLDLGRLPGWNGAVLADRADELPGLEGGTAQVAEIGQKSGR